MLPFNNLPDHPDNDQAFEWGVETPNIDLVPLVPEKPMRDYETINDFQVPASLPIQHKADSQSQRDDSSMVLLTCSLTNLI